MHNFTDIDDFILWKEPFNMSLNRTNLQERIDYNSLKEELIKHVNYQWRTGISYKKEIYNLINKINKILIKHDFCIHDTMYF